MKFIKENDEVLFLVDKYKIINQDEINNLIQLSLKTKRKIIRICTHDKKKSNLHEMFIIHPKTYYVRPQMHPKNESVTLIQGRGIIIIFDSKGNIKTKLPFDKKNFYYQIPKKTFHSLIILSKFIIFYETSLGPYKKKNNIYADWAPKDDYNEITNYQKKLLLTKI